jgi:hypothetical protein
MTLRPPAEYGAASACLAVNPVEVEILAEKASALGRAGRKVEVALSRLREHDGEAVDRVAALKDAAEAVWAYFIQRELCGFRRHQDVIREYAIPNEVLVRLGAK